MTFKKTGDAQKLGEPFPAKKQKKSKKTEDKKPGNKRETK